jgi:hypothetical protein
MPSIVTLMNDKKVYATQEPAALAVAAQEKAGINATVDGKPDVHVVVANIATITEGAAPSRKLTMMCV